jgi:hypothetical protein
MEVFAQTAQLECDARAGAFPHFAAERGHERFDVGKDDGGGRRSFE